MHWQNLIDYQKAYWPTKYCVVYVVCYICVPLVVYMDRMPSLFTNKPGNASVFRKLLVLGKRHSSSDTRLASGHQESTKPKWYRGGSWSNYCVWYLDGNIPIWGRIRQARVSATFHDKLNLVLHTYNILVLLNSIYTYTRRYRSLVDMV